MTRKATCRIGLFGASASIPVGSRTGNLGYTDASNPAVQHEVKRSGFGHVGFTHKDRRMVSVKRLVLIFIIIQLVIMSLPTCIKAPIAVLDHRPMK